MMSDIESKIMPFVSLQSSVFGLAFASLLLGELISIHQIIAIVVMIAGIYLINIEKENFKTNNTITSYY